MIVVQSMMQALDEGEADVVLLTSVPVDSPLYRSARTFPKLLLRDHIPVMNTHWLMSVPESLDSFYSKISRKHRYWTRRLFKVLEKDFPHGVSYRCFRSKDEVEELCEHSEQVAKKTYQRFISVGFRQSEWIQKLLEARADRDELRGYMLYVNNSPCSFWIGTRYGKTFYLDYTGYDTALHAYSPGLLVFIKMIEDLCTDKDLEFIDFGFGDAPYKSRYGEEHWSEASVYIFSRSFFGHYLNALRSFTSVLHGFGTSFLQRTNLLHRVKKIWRMRLATREKSGSEPDSDS